MRSAFRWGVLLSITSGACAGGGPPLDELPLRDTLRADPEVVAALSDDARARLAARFQTAAARDTASDVVEPGQPAPARVIAQLDVARQSRSADALLIGVLGGGAAQALPAGTQAASVAPLPSLEGTAATTTADLEARALEGAAGASLRELLAATHAQRLQRVVGWPVGAAALGDTVYVNGAWLVALAPVASKASAADAGACADAGCDGGAPDARSGAQMSGTGGASGWSGPTGGRRGADGGVPPDGGAGGRPWFGPPPYTQIPPYTPPSYTPPPPPPDSTGGDLNDAADAADGCAGLADACASTDDGGDDSCDTQDDGSADSCSNQDDSSQQDCSTPPDDGGGADCRTAPGRGRTNIPTMLWMFAPLIYLSGRKR